MKEYTVYFEIRRNRHGYLKQHTVDANNKKQAFELVEAYSQTTYKRHAFNKTTEPPQYENDGIFFNGMLWTRARGNQLW